MADIASGSFIALEIEIHEKCIALWDTVHSMVYCIRWSAYSIYTKYFHNTVCFHSVYYKKSSMVVWYV